MGAARHQSGVQGDKGFIEYLYCAGLGSTPDFYSSSLFFFLCFAALNFLVNPVCFLRHA
jgi:hypothetical protein